MTTDKFKIRGPLQYYVELLVEICYKNLGGREIRANWGRTTAFATISMNKTGPIEILCNKVTQEWPEPALIGLLSHELSHLTIGDARDAEHVTDIDVIERGLGVYLAIERVIADKYADHIIRKGRDKYLGYSSIRERLTRHELQQLDKLMLDIGLISSRPQS